MRNQATIKNTVGLSGRGLHSGETVKLQIRPAEADTGIVFARTDVEGTPTILADHSRSVRGERQTTLREGSHEVQTVEHLLAALGALQIDNAVVEIDGAEIPGEDGCAARFCELVTEAGREEQKAPRKRVALDRAIVVENDGVTLVAMPNDKGLRVSYTLDYGDAGVAPQTATFDVDADVFREQIAPARTFCLEAEARALQAAGFGKGADTDNTLVIRPGGTVVDNELRFADEFARHKILDLVGDLTLLGADLNAHVVAQRSGHASNVQLVKEISRHVEELENQGAVQRDTGLDIREIMKIIPHRYPFLFIDRVVEIDGFKRAVAIKNVSFNEPHFQGHWPDQPIMPGVLQVEALAQLAGVLLMRRMDNTGKIAVLLSIDTIKFRRPVVPGDQLRLDCETLNIRSKSGKVVGRGTVNGELTCEAVLKFMLMDA